MNKKMVKLLSLLLLSISFFVMQNSLAFASNDVWFNDLKSVFLNNRAIILAINIRSFNAEDKNGDDIIQPDKGDIAGNFVNAVKRLDELKSYGINTIHLLPVTPVGKTKARGTAGSLYAISDFTKLDPMLDDTSNKLTVEEEAKQFIDECHKRDIRVIVDLPSCGSYDLFLKKPELFVTGSDGKPVVPMDWTDVRVFKSNNADGSINEALYNEYKAYVDMVQKLGADGIRADVATSKTAEFWKKLISYAKSQDPEFLFLAEASECWNEPIAQNAPFTPYYELLDAGFDGWYGNFIAYKNWKTQEDFVKNISLTRDIIKSYAAKKTPKAVIGSFATHDEVSPVITGGIPFSQQIIWLQATLPVNSYFVDGFQTGDAYNYKYANKKATQSYTDDNVYFVNKGKFDIFNLSRKPGAVNNKLIFDFAVANQFKANASNMLNKGEYTFLKTGNKNAFAYMITFHYSSVLVLFNKDLSYSQTVEVPIKDFKSPDMIVPLAFTSTPLVEKNKIKSNLMPGEIQVFMISRANEPAKSKKNNKR